MKPLRIALLTYRGNPHSGGQGVYVRNLSRALTDLGHSVTVLSGQPYPELHDGIELQRLPSLDLYRAEDPFRRPKFSEFRNWIDVAEYGVMCTAGFPEPLTFTFRAAAWLAEHRRRFDVVHDNQSLGYGLLQIRRLGLPVVATVHHPCSIDRRIELTHVDRWQKRASLRRWYGFTKMQSRVAQRLGRVMTVSRSAREDVVRELGLDARDVTVIPNGVDADLFRPLPEVTKRPGRIVTTASADVPLKGLPILIEAVAKLRTERDAHLVVIGKPPRKGPTREAIERLAMQDAVHFETAVGWDRLVQIYAEAQVAVVPSLYEGFSLPAAEAMSCGVPLVATTAGALPEVVGDAAASVPPGDPGALAAAIAELLDDPRRREELSTAGRARVLDRFTWRSTALATVDEYRRACSC